MVEGQDYVERALRAWLEATLSYLVYDVMVMPVKQGGDPTHLSPVQLAGAREGGASSRPGHRHAGQVVPTVPDYPPGPGLELVLPYDAGRDRGWPPALADGGYGYIR